jgi:hypothetical protein
MYTITSDGMNHPAEELASHMLIDEGDIQFERPLYSCVNEDVVGCEVNGLALIRHSQQVTYFIILDPSRLLELPHPAPPPKLHYSTWWRSITRRIYRANKSSCLHKL